MQIDTDLLILKEYPESHGFSSEHVNWISELDHWGKFEAEMIQAGKDIRKIRDEERDAELLEYTKDLNTT